MQIPRGKSSPNLSRVIVGQLEAEPGNCSRQQAVLAEWQPKAVKGVPTGDWDLRDDAMWPPQKLLVG